MREIPKNVLDFIASASKMYGDVAAEQFSQEMFNQAVDNHKSPIEDIFCAALHLQCFARYTEISPPIIFIDGKPALGCGLYIYPQHPIGKYKVDFLLNCGGSSRTELIVELDGHDFHDKDKHQRAYEKSRDRYFAKQGISVMHFTGSEICQDPYKAAFEVLDFFHQVEQDEQYDPKDPLGCGGREGGW